MLVTQLINSNGNPASNQFVINTEQGSYFQSYETLIAFKSHCGGGVVVTDSWNFSNTTLKHLKIFLGTDKSKKELQKQIDQGSIILDNNLSIK